MGRHTAPIPADGGPAAGTGTALLERGPSTLPVITVAMLRPQPPAPERPTSGQRQPIAAPEPVVAAPAPPRPARRPQAVPVPPRVALAAQPAPPVPTARLPRTEPVPLVAPDLGAHSLSTGPIPVQRRRTGRRRVRAARLAVALAAVAIAGAVATQLTTQRSEADAGGLLSFLPAATTSAAGTTTSSSTSSSASSTSAQGATTAPTTAPAASGSTTTPSTSGSPTHSSPAPSRSGSSSAAAPSSTAVSSSSAPRSSSPSRASTPTNARSLSTALGAGRDLAAGLFTFSDFGSDLLGMDLTGRLTGAGSGSTVVEMTPMSSSKGSRVPTKAWTTNQLSLIRISRASVISGFTLQGTKQGHLYNGLRISRSTDPRISDVRVLAVPGDDDIPPGETFGINDFHTSGASYSDVEVDGGGVSGAAFGANDSDDVSISGSSFHDAGYSNGATFWQTRNVTVRDTTSVDNKDAAFNFERVSGSVVLDHVTMHGNGLSDLRIDNDQASATYRIIDPVLHGSKMTIVMTPKYMGHPNLQKKSDVHLIVHGVDRPDLITWVDHF